MGRWIGGGIGAGIAAGMLSLVFWLVMTGPVGVSQNVSSPIQPVGPLSKPMIVVSCVVAGLVAGVIAGLLAKRPNGAKMFTIISIVLVILSMISPVMQPADISWNTRWVLIICHLIAFAAIWGFLNQELRKASANAAS